MHSKLNKLGSGRRGLTEAPRAECLSGIQWVSAERLLNPARRVSWHTTPEDLENAVWYWSFPPSHPHHVGTPVLQDREHGTGSCPKAYSTHFCRRMLPSTLLAQSLSHSVQQARQAWQTW